MVRPLLRVVPGWKEEGRGKKREETDGRRRDIRHLRRQNRVSRMLLSYPLQSNRDPLSNPSPPPSYPPRQIHSPNENLWGFYCLPRDYTSLYHFFSFSFENRKSFSFVESSFLLLSCKMLLLLSENGEEERKRRQGRKEKSDKKFLRQFKSNGLAGLQRHSLSARSWS